MWPVVKLNSINTMKIAYWWKIHSFTSRPSPPLWYPYIASNTTHRSPLVRHPINCHVSMWLSLVKACRHHTRSKLFVTDIFNPRHGGFMHIWLVTGIDMIDGDLHFNGFVGIEHVRLETDCFAMRVPQWWNMWHMTATSLEWKSLNQNRKETKFLQPWLKIIQIHQSYAEICLSCTDVM